MSDPLELSAVLRGALHTYDGASECFVTAELFPEGMQRVRVSPHPSAAISKPFRCLNRNLGEEPQNVLPYK